MEIKFTADFPLYHARAIQKFALFLLLTLFSANISAQSPAKNGRLVVSKDGYALQFEDGTPFFWLGDTGWEMFSRLTLEEMKVYLDNRAAKGFNVIQVSGLSVHDLKSPNRYGELPLDNLDPLKPNERYFAVIDSVMSYALKRNLFIGLVATWGDKVVEETFDSTKAYAYGKWLGIRYKNFSNIVWIVGGDQSPVKGTSDYRSIWRAMANGIIDGTGHRCLITYHPAGERSSSEWLHKEPWLDFNMIQSSHGRQDCPVWDMVRKDRSNVPSKPTLDSEPNYEDHPINPWPKWNVDNGYFRDYDVRKQIYRSVFAGGFGVTYGHHAIWQFLSEREEVINYADRGWVNAMDRPGAYQAGHLRKLIESRPMRQRVPDLTMIAEGQGEGSEHIEAFRSMDNSYAMIYLPIGKKIALDMSFMRCKNIIAWWFNPKDASIQKIGVLPRTARMEFTSPLHGAENDWVLVVDDATKKFKEPGKL